jgi:hypothetical protein
MHHFASLYDVTDHIVGIKKLLESDSGKVLLIRPKLKNLDTGEEESICMSIRHDLPDDDGEGADEEDINGAGSEAINNAFMSAILYQYVDKINEQMETSKPIRDLMQDMWLSSTTIGTLLDYYIDEFEVEVNSIEPIGAFLIGLETETAGIGYACGFLLTIDDKHLMLMFHRNNSVVIRNATTMFRQVGEGPEYITTFMQLLHPATGIPTDLKSILTYSMDDYTTNPEIAKYIKYMYAMQTPDNSDMTRLYRSLKPLNLFTRDDIEVADFDELTGVYFDDAVLCDLLDELQEEEIEVLDEDFIMEVEFMADLFKQKGESFEIVPKLVVMTTDQQRIVENEASDHLGYFMGLRRFRSDLPLPNSNQLINFIYDKITDEIGRLSQLKKMDYLPIPDEQVIMLSTPIGDIELSNRLPVWYYLVQLPLFIYAIKTSMNVNKLMEEAHYGPGGLLYDETQIIVHHLQQLIDAEKNLS